MRPRTIGTDHPRRIITKVEDQKRTEEIKFSSLKKIGCSYEEDRENTEDKRQVTEIISDKTLIKIGRYSGCFTVQCGVYI